MTYCPVFGFCQFFPAYLCPKLPGVGLLILGFLGSQLLMGCAHFDQLKQQARTPAPVDYAQPKTLAGAIDQGGELFMGLLNEMGRSSSEAQKVNDMVNQHLPSLIIAHSKTWNLKQLERATEILHYSDHSYPWLVFSHILNSPHQEGPAMAWKSLTSVTSSHDHQLMVDSVLSKALSDNDLDRHLVPEMADVVRLWKVTTVYDVVKLGLLSKGDPGFALAMAHLKPKQASDDFLNYLALVPDSDLRQLSMASIQDLTASQILNHLHHHPPNIAHRHISKLFVFAASRQMNLRQVALSIVDKIVPTAPPTMSYLLSRQPKWVQQTIIEEARRAMTAQRKLLLTGLSELTPDKDILEEISWLDSQHSSEQQSSEAGSD